MVQARGVVACLTALATGCASSGKVGEAQDVGERTYSIAVGSGAVSRNLTTQ